MSEVSYEWDPAKRLENLAKHGVDFTAAHVFDWDTAVVFEDGRKDYGEARFLAYGYVSTRLHAVVFTDRAGIYRIISFRKANRREQAAYAPEPRR
ncbi:MAG: BrnT family toxin [Amaricoccus sp.]|uniref:BrnT family toxin n=1 Tax=Amaricoccus sp. TaxID=1872485 RepID=UPI0039E33517